MTLDLRSDTSFSIDRAATINEHRANGIIRTPPCDIFCISEELFDGVTGGSGVWGVLVLLGTLGILLPVSIMLVAVCADASADGF